MPTLNFEKCYTAQENRLIIEVPKTYSDHWRTDFYELLSAQLKLNNDTQIQVDDNPQTDTTHMLTEKEAFFKNLERHLGEESTYTFKGQLLDSFRTLYFIFTHCKTTDDQKHLIASRIAENLAACTDGFSNQVKYLIPLFNMPKNLDELIAEVRFKLVDRIARTIARENSQSVHLHSRVIDLARTYGFGICPTNLSDSHLRSGSQHLLDRYIFYRVKTGFSYHFQLFALLNALRDELDNLIVRYGYKGRYELENDYKYAEYNQFITCINRIIPIKMEYLLEMNTSGNITNINWQYVKRQLLQKLRDENYVILSQEEALLLDNLLQDENRPLDLTTLNTLIPHGYELGQCLEYFSEWSKEQKAALVSAYLNNKSPTQQRDVLVILHNEALQLTTQLKKELIFQGIYFAITEKDVALLRAEIEQGEDINKALWLLFSSAHKRDTLYWLHEHPHLLQMITVAGMNIVIREGKYRGQTIAQTLVSTKKGRQLLLENEGLQTLLAQTTMADQLYHSRRRANTERRSVSSQEGFFKKSFPLAIELVQSVVYGDLIKSEALLKANPDLLKRLLTERVTVFDYSKRKVKKTAFQAALCALDLELATILSRYMDEKEIVIQSKEIFPEWYNTPSQEQKMSNLYEEIFSGEDETVSKKPTAFNFSQIVQKITESSEADAQKSLRLWLPNNTSLWENIQQFRADFTKCSSQDVVFNPKHLINAFDVYYKKSGTWSWIKRALFWLQVIGYVQRFLPANIAMDFAQGFYFRVVKKEKSNRSFKFRDEHVSIFPLDFDSFSGLGYEYAVGPEGLAKRGIFEDALSSWFEQLCGEKTAALKELCSQHRRAPKHAADEFEAICSDQSWHLPPTRTHE